MTIAAIHKAYQDGITPVDIVRQLYLKIAAINDPRLFITLFDEAVVCAQAAALGSYDPAKPLWGIPFAIKDNIDAAGYPTTAGCPAFSYRPAADAFVVAALKQAGALLIGKTNLDQFATGLVGVRSPYGAPLNAVDPSLLPGGSSSGSAVIVGHGAIPFSLGTDTAGSGRVPAAFNNIVGLKPTLGALSASGVVPACRSIETISIFASTVADAYEVFKVANGFDHQDIYARQITQEALFEPRSGLKVGVPSSDSIEFFGDHLQQKFFTRSLKSLANLGYQLTEIDFTPLYAIADMLYQGAWVAERYTVIEALLKTDPDAIHPVTKNIILHAEKQSAVDAFKGFYKLKTLMRSLEPTLARVDLLCVPTIPTFYTLADLVDDPIKPNQNLGTYTNFVNLMDMCAVTVPGPAREDGKPGSITLLAAKGQDALVASVARQFETIGSAPNDASKVPSQAAQPVRQQDAESIIVAVCGAHMTGLPLNAELTQRGATFIETALSAPDYRFYALAGGPPLRPGMVRCSPGRGGAIELELWSMPAQEFGGFIAKVPPPLGIGTLTLANGEQVKGFICEAIGAEGAQDITALASWRLFLTTLESAS